jgi:hypothetical protein
MDRRKHVQVQEVKELRLSLREDSRRIDGAIEAVRPHARDMSPPDIRGLLVNELRARGLMLPPPAVDSLVDQLIAGTGATGWMRRLVRGVTGGAELANSLAKFPGAATGHASPPGLLGMHQILSDPRRQPAEVTLDPGAQETLSIPAHDVMNVWLRLSSPQGPRPGPAGASPETHPGEDNPVEVYLGDQRIGVLSPQARQAYLADVERSRDADLMPVTLAIRSKASNSSWRLHVGRPLHPIPKGQDAGSGSPS